MLLILCLASINADNATIKAIQNSSDLIELKTEAINIKNCIQLFRSNHLAVANDEQTLRSLIRNDLSREQCLKDLINIDLNKYSLLGVNINSGWCRTPMGLKYQTLKDVINKRYLFVISYEEPVEPCRALSSYDLWVLVPKLPEGYQVVVKENPIKPTQKL